MSGNNRNIPGRIVCFPVVRNHIRLQFSFDNDESGRCTAHRKFRKTNLLRQFPACNNPALYFPSTCRKKHSKCKQTGFSGEILDYYTLDRIIIPEGFQTLKLRIYIEFHLHCKDTNVRRPPEYSSPEILRQDEISKV